jgi:tRNA dimethylallyltransferase
VAQRLGADILSVDSMQVYRGMDIGTAKPSGDDRAGVAHHMLDLVEPEDEFSVAEFQRVARRVLETSEQPVVIAGGSGLHFRAVVDPLEFPPHDQDLRAELELSVPDDLRAELIDADPAAGDLVDLDNPRRVIRAVEILRLVGATPTQRAGTSAAVAVRNYQARHPVVAVGIDPLDRLALRIEVRLDSMLDRGLLEEVTALGGRLGRTAAQAVGYKELIPVVEGRQTVGAARSAALAATLGLARRQRTFFRRDPRIVWLDDQFGVDSAVESIVDMASAAMT